MAKVYALPNRVEWGDLEGGWRCTWCGTHHAFGVYGAAHWDISLTHTCPECGAKHHCLRGVCERVKDGKKEFKK